MNIQRLGTDTMLVVWFQKVVDALVHRLNSPDSSRCHVLCLKTLRMFSREKDKLVNMVSEIAIATIMKMTGLNHYAVEEGDLIEIQNGDPEGKREKEEREREREKEEREFYNLLVYTVTHRHASYCLGKKTFTFFMQISIYLFFIFFFASRCYYQSTLVAFL